MTGYSDIEQGKKPNIACPECDRELSAQDNGLVMYHSAPGRRDTCEGSGKAVDPCGHPDQRYEMVCRRPKGHDGRHAYILGGEVRKRPAPVDEPVQATEPQGTTDAR